MVEWIDVVRNSLHVCIFLKAHFIKKYDRAKTIKANAFLKHKTDHSIEWTAQSNRVISLKNLCYDVRWIIVGIVHKEIY